MTTLPRKRVDAYFVVHTRPGDSFEVDFALLAATGCRLYLITAEAVRPQVEARGLHTVFSDITYVSAAPSAAEIIEVIDARVKKGESFDIGTVSESRVDVCGKVKQHYGIIADDYSRFIDKNVMKNYLKRFGVRVPHHLVLSRESFQQRGRQYLDEVCAQVPLPGFVKPLNMYGAFNTARVDSKQELHDWFASVKDDPYTYEIEEFIDGNLYICDSVVVDGRVAFDQVSEYSSPCAAAHDGVGLGWITLPEHDPLGRRISGLSRYINEVMLPAASGVTHLEAFHTPGDDLIFLEVAYRPLGVVTEEFYLKRAGLPIRAIHHLVQIDPSTAVDFPPRLYIFIHVLPTPTRPARVKSLRDPQIRSPHSVKWNYGVGDLLPANKGFNEILVTILAWNEDYEALRKDFDSLRSATLFESDDGELSGE